MSQPDNTPSSTPRRRLQIPSQTATRSLDMLAAALALAFLTPLMLLVAAAILFENGRPVFFSQTRLGLSGRPFRMHKFRKFAAGTVSGRPLTMADDPRLTRVGTVLARTKLDELPQLWNVLKGEMALVGPRPESLYFRDCFAGRYWGILEYKPGIFGPSQTTFRNESAFYHGRDDAEDFYRRIVFPLKAEIDLAYFAKRSVFGDIGWVVRGALAVFACSSLPREGARLVTAAEGPTGPGSLPFPEPPVSLPPVRALAPRPAILAVRLAATGQMRRRSGG